MALRLASAARKSGLGRSHQCRALKGDLHALRWIAREGGKPICEVVVNAAPITQPHQLLHRGVCLGYIYLSRKRWHREIPLKAKRSNKNATLRERRGPSRAPNPVRDRVSSGPPKG